MLRRSRASCNFKPRGQRVANLRPEMTDQEGMGPRQVSWFLPQYVAQNLTAHLHPALFAQGSHEGLLWESPKD